MVILTNLTIIIAIIIVAHNISHGSTDDTDSLKCENNPCRNGGSCLRISVSLIPTECPKQFKAIANGCVKRITGVEKIFAHENWFEASRHCREMGASLFSPLTVTDITDMEQFRFGQLTDSAIEFWTSGAFYENRWWWTDRLNSSIQYDSYFPKIKLESENTRLYPCLSLMHPSLPSNESLMDQSNDNKTKPSPFNLLLVNSDCQSRKQIICQSAKAFPLDRKYQCVCPVGFVGKNCEKPLSYADTTVKVVSFNASYKNITLRCPNNTKNDKNTINQKLTFLHIESAVIDTSVNERRVPCYAPQALAYIVKRCNGLSICSLPTTALFDDLNLRESCETSTMANNKITCAVRYQCISDLKNECPPETYAFDKGCYHFHLESETRKTWLEARESCLLQGGDIVTLRGIRDNYIERLLQSLLRSSQEHNALNKFLAGEVFHVWIGLKRSDYGGKKFEWIDGSQSAYRHWKPTFLDIVNDKTRNCGSLEIYSNLTSTPLIWSLENCEERYNWICRLPAHTYPTYLPRLKTKTLKIVPPGKKHNLRCHNVKENNEYWHETSIGMYSFTPCGNKTQGIRYRKCIRKATSKAPSFETVINSCSQPEYSAISKMLKQNKPAGEISSSLLNATRNISNLKAVDIQVTSVLINNILDLQARQLGNASLGPKERQQLSKTFTKSIGTTSSNLIDAKSQDSWKSMEDKEKTATINQILGAMSKNFEIIAQHDPVPAKYEFDNLNIKNDLVAGNSPTGSKADWEFAINEEFEDALEDEDSPKRANKLSKHKTQISFLNHVHLKNIHDGEVVEMQEFVSFVLYKSLNNLFPQISSGHLYMKSKSLTADENREILIRHPVITVNAKLIEEERSQASSKPSAKLEIPLSKVIPGIDSNQKLNIYYHIADDLKSSVGNKYKCVYWNDRQKENLHWDDYGCTTTVIAKESRVSCTCNHTTSFAVLTDFKSVLSTGLTPFDTIALDLITNVGLVISILSLAATITIFIKIRSLNNERTSIHMNVCGCLLLSECIFMAGINFVHNVQVCKGVAIALHYTFLATFCWILMEGVYLFILLKQVFDEDRSYLKYNYLVAYTLPLIIVSVTVGIRPNGYGTDKSCWLTSDQGMIWAFMGPLLFIILLNVVILVYSLMRVLHIKAPSGDKTGRFWKWVKGSMLLLSVLGVTWIFGFLFISAKTIVFAYIFCILNSFQGLFLFMFHVWTNDRTKGALVRKLKRSKFLDKYLSSVIFSTNGFGTAAASTESTTLGKKGLHGPVGPYFLTNFSIRGFKPLTNSEVADDTNFSAGKYNTLTDH